jgi:hypothetical protein
LIVVSIMRLRQGARQAPRVKPLVGPIMLRWINFLARLSGARRGLGVPVSAGFCWSSINATNGIAAMNGI